MSSGVIGGKAAISGGMPRKSALNGLSIGAICGSIPFAKAAKGLVGRSPGPMRGPGGLARIRSKGSGSPLGTLLLSRLVVTFLPYQPSE